VCFHSSNALNEGARHEEKLMLAANFITPRVFFASSESHERYRFLLDRIKTSLQV
jgi:hypothetical protein